MPDLITAALAAFPRNPDSPTEVETVTGYEPYRDDDDDRDYHITQIGSAEPIARGIVVAVLLALADSGGGIADPDLFLAEHHRLTRLAERIAAAAPATQDGGGTP